MAVLIVGAGLVGSQVLRLEIERGERPVVVDSEPRFDALAEACDVSRARVLQLDIVDYEDLLRIFKTEEVTKVIHTAANPMLTRGAQENPREAIMTNVAGTANLLEAARQGNVSCFVFASSNVLTHDVVDEVDGQKRPSSIYGSTKLACEHLGMNYHDAYGLEFVALRFAAVFGPWKYGGGGGPSSRFRQLLEDCLSGKMGSLSRQRIEYVYSKDAAKACELACHKEDRFKKSILDIGMGRVYETSEIATIIETVVPGSTIAIVDDPATSMRRAEAEEKTTELELTKSELGFSPRFMMEDAISDYVSWLSKKIPGT